LRLVECFSLDSASHRVFLPLFHILDQENTRKLWLVLEDDVQFSIIPLKMTLFFCFGCGRTRNCFVISVDFVIFDLVSSHGTLDFVWRASFVYNYSRAVFAWFSCLNQRFLPCLIGMKDRGKFDQIMSLKSLGKQ
jgi:hypothetical protein